MFGSGSNSGRKYDFKMVVHLACDSRTQVRDISGDDFEIDSGETLAEAQERLVDRCMKEHRIRGAHPVQILSFDYWG